MKKLITLMLALALLCAACALAEADAADAPEINAQTDAARDDTAVDTADWSYYTFEGSGVAMKLPPDFADDDELPIEGVFYNAGDADVMLQVIPTDDTFTDRDALMEFYNTQEYIVRSTPLEINGVDLVYAEGADDGAMVYAAISAEGTTYQFVFLPQSDRGEAVIEAITATICSSEQIPEA